jgi:hypothetical protein
MSRACAALSDFNFSSEDSSSSEEDEKVNYNKKECDFTGLCLMAKGRSLWNNYDSDFDVSDDLTYDGLSLKRINLRMPCVVKTSCSIQFFHENKDLNLKLENSFSGIASL